MKSDPDLNFDEIGAYTLPVVSGYDHMMPGASKSNVHGCIHGRGHCG